MIEVCRRCLLFGFILFSIIYYFDFVIVWVMVKFIIEEIFIFVLLDYYIFISKVYCIMILGYLI